MVCVKLACMGDGSLGSLGCMLYAHVCMYIRVVLIV